MIGFKCIGCNYNTELFEILLIYFDRQSVATVGDHTPFEQYETGLLAETTDGGLRLALCKMGTPVAEVVLDQSARVDNTPAQSMFTDPFKNAVKRTAAALLTKETGYTSPWGIQTGVKPVKLATQCLAEGMSPQEGADFLGAELNIRDDKCNTLFRVAANESTILKSTPTNSFSLYVGTPFCPTICSYCSFGAYPIGRYETWVDRYVDAVVAEARATAEVLIKAGLTCDCCYFGGGTPTSVTAAQLDRIMSGVLEAFPSFTELTCEAGRPDSIDVEKLEVLRRHGVHRLAINPQTMKGETLAKIGRRHTPEDTIRVYELARNMGFDNINMDLIAGLEGETEEDFAETLRQIRQLKPQGFTVHSLCLKRASAMMRGENRHSTDHSVMDRMVNMGYETAAAMGMEPYYLYRQKNAAGNLENTGFARPGYFCRYNVLIEEETQHILGLGAGSVTKRVVGPGDLERCFNIKDPLQYIAGIDGQITKKIDFLSNMY